MIIKSLADIEKNLLGIKDSYRLLSSNKKIVKIKEINGVSYWEYQINEYPNLELAHFQRLRWPTKSEFKTIEYFAIDLLIKNRVCSNKYLARGGNEAWTYFSTTHIRRRATLISALKEWLKRGRYNKKNAIELVQKYQCKSFPDLIDFNPKTKKLRVWEVKGLFDVLSSRQKNLLEDMAKIGIESNVLLVEFIDKKEKSKMKRFRQEIVIQQNQLKDSFLNSGLRKKLYAYLLLHINITIQRFPYQPQLGKIDYWMSKGDKVIPVGFEIYDNFYGSPYEILNVIYKCLPHNDEPINFNNQDKNNIFSPEEVVELSLYFYNLGNYKWWVTPFILMPFMRHTKNHVQYQELLRISALFETLFKTGEKVKDLHKAQEFYLNGETKKMNKIYLKLIDNYRTSNTY